MEVAWELGIGKPDAFAEANGVNAMREKHCAGFIGRRNPDHQSAR
jgi:hypothetical protein